MTLLIVVSRWVGQRARNYDTCPFEFSKRRISFPVLKSFPGEPDDTIDRVIPIRPTKAVPRTDVNPRPLSTLVPSNGLIGCFSQDEQWIFGMAFEPYQELFQGVARCLHSDFRIGTVKPGESKKVRGKIYLMRNDVDALLKRYAKDFPEQQG